jgi:hypothetical protein
MIGISTHTPIKHNNTPFMENLNPKCNKKNKKCQILKLQNENEIEAKNLSI